MLLLIKEKASSLSKARIYSCSNTSRSPASASQAATVNFSTPKAQNPEIPLWKKPKKWKTKGEKKGGGGNKWLINYHPLFKWQFLYLPDYKSCRSSSSILFWNFQTTLKIYEDLLGEKQRSWQWKHLFPVYRAFTLEAWQAVAHIRGLDRQYRFRNGRAISCLLIKRSNCIQETIQSPGSRKKCGASLQSGRRPLWFTKGQSRKETPGLKDLKAPTEI